MGVYVNQKRIRRNEVVTLKHGDIITFGVDLSQRDHSKDSLKFLSFELKFKLTFIDLTLSEHESDVDENDNNKKSKSKPGAKPEESLKMIIKTTKNDDNTFENVSKHRINQRSTFRNSAESSTSHSNSDDQEMKPKKNDKTAEKFPTNEMKSDKTKAFKNVVENTFGRVSKNDRSPHNETVRKSATMVEILKNSPLIKPKCAIQIDALPQINGKRRACEKIESSSKVMTIESTSQSVRESPILM